MLHIITGNLQAAYSEFGGLRHYDLIHLDKNTLSRIEPNVVIDHPDEEEAIELHMNQKGLFDKHFPDGFMDTWDKALEELLDT